MDTKLLDDLEKAVKALREAWNRESKETHNRAYDIITGAKNVVCQAVIDLELHWWNLTLPFRFRECDDCGKVKLIEHGVCDACCVNRNKTVIGNPNPPTRMILYTACRQCKSCRAEREGLCINCWLSDLRHVENSPCS